MEQTINGAGGSTWKDAAAASHDDLSISTEPRDRSIEIPADDLEGLQSAKKSARAKWAKAR